MQEVYQEKSTGFRFRRRERNAPLATKYYGNVHVSIIDKSVRSQPP